MQTKLFSTTPSLIHTRYSSKGHLMIVRIMTCLRGQDEVLSCVTPCMQISHFCLNLFYNIIILFRFLFLPFSLCWLLMGLVGSLSRAWIWHRMPKITILVNTLTWIFWCHRLICLQLLNASLHSSSLAFYQVSDSLSPESLFS